MVRKRSRGWRSTGGSGFGTPPKADPLTGGTPYSPVVGSITPTPAGSGPSPAAAPAATQSAAPVVNFKDGQYTQDTSSIITGAGQTASEFGANAPKVSWVDKDGKPTTADDPNAKPVLGAANVDWSNPDGVAKLNPFSRAALLIRSYQQGVQGTSNSYAARGQHNSGAYGRAQNSNQFGFEQGRSGIDTALRNFITGANQGLGQATLNAQQRQADKPPELIKSGSPVGAVGTWTYGNQGANGAPSANQMLADYGSRPDQGTGDPYKAPGGLPTGTVKLANGWTLVYVNGKPKFIPPGGTA